MASHTALPLPISSPCASPERAGPPCHAISTPLDQPSQPYQAHDTFSDTPIRHAVEETASAAPSPDIKLDRIVDDDDDDALTPPTQSTSLFSPFAIPTSSTDRISRRDDYLYSLFWPPGLESLQRIIAGAVRCPVLPPFALTMSSLRRKSSVPSTPRVISPSPTASDQDGQEYFAPITRSTTRKRLTTPQPVDEHGDEESNYSGTALRRSRTRSRSPIKSQPIPRMTTRRPSEPAKVREPVPSDGANGKSTASNGKPNGHLAPPPSGWTWRDLSRSPSPLGLIPIHRHWRTFVHKHEVPRKILHVSIGFFVLWLYASGTQTTAVAPYIMAALIPIAATDWLRHHYPSFNGFYVRVLGALMRESEYSGWNGVIFYLLGAWTVLYFFPKDVAVMSILLLAWCDTAASTFGRLWGRYTPRIRRGKSLAGSLAALLVGVATSVFFYGWIVPVLGPKPGDEDFMFNGSLFLPKALASIVGLEQTQSFISGTLALGVVSVWSGFVASVSEVIDVFGWDDNLTIPVLSGVGLWGFFKIFA
ncbi:hypothetical protein S7711_07434 [Stachybotrys chartarum IBT 7711]|uniref:Phosphatidate cytidylyltransferase n=1 Tax=Stachybotrys chartarum (strain CBS 109288 / IBT 7711) TaxID=1280523 RepID=A0A084AFJ3_STACB|nr:hypothetical protein S7711_07434 [Stachybotrys chartarum IBT 7711]